ncbi:uncharacterized protein PV07_01977 [Cladophialophora immunda]|uniref:Uncharacterized protein n=1 Tax=Cladophialophora immunda TaxID=569365 RepID=A0A0D2CVZ5_9EURO|nr:uncharacterized protein PV07_01977 [Cladophialophora immunda]KIW35273.1 hypothetical protein PV07_01977 [Cladophialophora immunda]OQV07307.1 hypothetical protein CLAIMM_11761 [Cladophialophora immunda]
MASFFALAIQQFPKDKEGNKSRPRGYVSGLIFGISFAVSIPFIIFAFNIGLFQHLWIKVWYIWPKLLLLGMLSILSHLKIFGIDKMSSGWKRGTQDSMNKYDPNYGAGLMNWLAQDNVRDAEDFRRMTNAYEILQTEHGPRARITTHLV